MRPIGIDQTLITSWYNALLGCIHSKPWFIGGSLCVPGNGCAIQVPTVAKHQLINNSHVASSSA